MPHAVPQHQYFTGQYFAVPRILRGFARPEHGKSLHPLKCASFRMFPERARRSAVLGLPLQENAHE